MLAEVLEPYRSEKHLEEVIDFLIKHPNLYDAIKKLAKTNHNQQQLSQYVATMIHELLKIE